MTTSQVEILEKDEIRLVGFSVKESLNNILANRTVGILREDLDERKNEVENREGDGIYLIQLYSAGGWTPDTPFENIIAVKVSSFGEIPSDMITHVVPAGRYAKFVHVGLESEISNTYERINNYALRPFDIEYWEDIHSLETQDSEIDIYIPVE
ncbi:GyrI-like domain-containing protein [Lederbergia citri]|uniref:GyrI-like domain-containing protein n=1 Tax=Lederbergia citri TaxID=2833580 RepID=A0A942YH12_9BACI|nr:GyrI-like domain-containing protein [Lederbergia citri]MBS4196082.1 GyrI-like domain-containing protein [Lederbergia citri]